MSVEPGRYPVGASVTVDQLESAPYEVLARLQAVEPVSWIPAVHAWFITGRDQTIEAMRDAERFTVDDPRFTTAAVLGQSMLSLEGDEHIRHRTAFAEYFRPRAVRDGFESWLGDEARRLIQAGVQDNSIELRSALAGPLAVNTITRFLGLEGVDSAEVLNWYQHISTAIVDLSLGRPVSGLGSAAVDSIRERVNETLASDGTSSLIATIEQGGHLRPEELAPAVAVVMFGAIETSEGMTSNVLWHLLKDPETLSRVQEDRSLVPAAVEESLRLEPAAAVIDRYTTTSVELAGTVIPAGELVTISLLAGNRDPDVFAAPDRFDIDRDNLRQHLTFVQGPHACLGLHLARAETIAAVHAVLDLLPSMALDPSLSSAPEGLIFRKPASVTARL